MTHFFKKKIAVNVGRLRSLPTGDYEGEAGRGLMIDLTFVPWQACCHRPDAHERGYPKNVQYRVLCGCRILLVRPSFFPWGDDLS